jgi:UDP-N-acetyl-D-mannosaminuronic acid dehydrogenase
MNFSSLSVIGLGYIGLPTAAVFASRKIKVLGVDINQIAVDTINMGKIHIIEPDLDTAVHNAVAGGYLKASTLPEQSDAFIIAVPTPFKGNNHEPDLGYIEAASKSIAPFLRKGNLVILESTSPVGATEQLSAWLAELRTDLSFPQQIGEDSDIRIAYCPERVLPGHVMRELIENDRVIGGMTSRCSEYAVALYKLFVKGECITTNARTAEMTKLTENSFRDVNIAFANELSIICDKLEINVWELINLANRHPRVNILKPGPGVGGHCIAVDPWFIVHKTPDDAKLIRTARETNDSKPKWVIAKINEAINEVIKKDSSIQKKDIVIACYGLAFKPDIDDLRESPSREIVKQLKMQFDCKLLVIEPNVDYLPEDLKEVQLVNLEEARDSDVHLLLVDHKEFFRNKPSHGILVDTKGIW